MEEKRMMTQLEKAMMAPKSQLAKEVLDLRREVERLKGTLTEQRKYVEDLKAIVTVKEVYTHGDETVKGC